MTDLDRETAWLRDSFTAPLGAEDGAPDPDSCPSPERIWDAAQGALDPEATREVVEHTAICAACAEEWRLAVALGEGEAKGLSRTSEPAARNQVQAHRRPLPWAGAAAAALVAGMIGVSLFKAGHKPQPPADVDRGGEAAIELALPDRVTLDREHVHLSWKTGLEAQSYDVAVLDASGDTTYFRQTGLSAKEVDVPAANFSALPSASAVYWTVTAHLASGAAVESETRSFTLR